MRVTVCFYSYFKDLTGCTQTTEELPDGSTLDDLFKKLSARFPKLKAMQKSTLMAVGVDYQDRDYVLKEDDEVSLFPPVRAPCSQLLLIMVLHPLLPLIPLQKVPWQHQS